MADGTNVPGDEGAFWAPVRRRRAVLTARGVVVLVLGLALYLAGANVMARWVLFVAAVLIGATLWAAATTWWQTATMAIARVVPTTTIAGRQATVRIGVRGAGRASVVVVDGLTRMVGTLVSGRGTQPAWLAATVVPRRGRLDRSVRVRAVVYDPFGLFRIVVTADAPTGIETLPTTLPVMLPPPVASGHDSIPATNRQGTDVVGVREHTPTDPLRRVHWRLSARHGDLIVRELGGRAPGTLVVAISGGTWDEGALDGATALACGLATAAARMGHPVRLHADGAVLPWAPRARRHLAGLPPHAGAAARPLLAAPADGSAARIEFSPAGGGAVAVTLTEGGRSSELGRCAAEDPGAWLSARLAGARL